MATRQGYRFSSGGPHPKMFELRWSKAKSRAIVVCVDENWDYEDAEDAAELSVDLRDCASLSDAAEMLGLQGDCSDTAPDSFCS